LQYIIYNCPSSAAPWVASRKDLSKIRIKQHYLSTMSRTRYMIHAKEYVSLSVLGCGDGYPSNSGAAQAIAPVFPSEYLHDTLVKPPNMTERPKSVSTAFPSLLIRTLCFRKENCQISLHGYIRLTGVRSPWTIGCSWTAGVLDISKDMQDFGHTRFQPSSNIFHLL
jgi:hypothetical protein